MNRSSRIVADTQPALGVTELTKDGCVKQSVLDGQAFARTTYQVDAQTNADAEAVQIATGQGSNLCYTVLVLSVFYLAASILLFIYAANGSEIDLISSSQDSRGTVTGKVSHTWPLAWITAGAMAVVFAIYVGFGLLAGQSYFTAQVYARAESLSGFVSFGLHAIFLGAIVFLFNNWNDHVQFYLIVLGGAAIITFSYMIISHETGMERGWSFLTIVAFVAATLANFGQWILLFYSMWNESLDTWIMLMTWVYILTNAAYWANFLSWILALGDYAGVKAPRARYDEAGIIFLSILGLQMVGILLFYFFNDL